MQIESLHRKIVKSAMHPKCPQAVKKAVQRIASRPMFRYPGESKEHAADRRLAQA